MDDAAERFALRVTREGALRVEIGHAFDERDIPVLVAMQRSAVAQLPDLSAWVPRQREALEGARRVV